uniref:Uncharacterized protein n=1 Tax=Amphilophus citrinellus TaxID=61819 RepID=A0A3Q0RTK6_AMPCI
MYCLLLMQHIAQCPAYDQIGLRRTCGDPERGLSGQEEEAASLLLPEIIISIIFCNFQHLNRCSTVCFSIQVCFYCIGSVFLSASWMCSSKFVPQRMKTVLKAKRSPTPYQQGVPNKV